MFHRRHAFMKPKITFYMYVLGPDQAVHGSGLQPHSCVRVGWWSKYRFMYGIHSSVSYIVWLLWPRSTCTVLVPGYVYNSSRGSRINNQITVEFIWRKVLCLFAKVFVNYMGHDKECILVSQWWHFAFIFCFSANPRLITTCQKSSRWSEHSWYV